MKWFRALIVAALCLAPFSARAWWQSIQQVGVSVTAATTTWNPSDKDASISLSGGNLVATTANSGSFESVRAIANHSTGKFYFSSVTTGSNNSVLMGLCNASFAVSAGNPTSTTNCVSIAYTTGNIFLNGGICSGSAVAVSDVLDIAVDLGGKLFWYRVNGGAWAGNGGASPNPATGTNGCNISGLAAGPYFPTLSSSVSAVTTTNFGATAYTNAAPSGFGNW